MTKQILKARKKWLKDFKVGEDEVLYNEDNNREYIMAEYENGKPTEDGYTFRIIKVYLPLSITN